MDEPSVVKKESMVFPGMCLGFYAIVSDWLVLSRTLIGLLASFTSMEIGRLLSLVYQLLATISIHAETGFALKRGKSEDLCAKISSVGKFGLSFSQ